ncbi:MAG: nucleoside-diphosphate kinase [Elusimicrobiales bacterium]|nr:nucleoside-diphosphate kinase [Elusimicrobiales bacterium]MCK5358439.1 nucleoside-diphosphate kinase [Elusimicrobiales bacterium]
MAIEKTLILIKPDGISRKLSGLTIDRLDHAGFEMIGAKVVSVSDELAHKHYIELKDEPFFEPLMKFIQGGFHNNYKNKVLALVYQGENAIEEIRKTVGATNPEEADPTTIRGSFGRVATKGHYENVVHASGNAKDAARELALWFKPEELLD